jgi:hypothetical protein
VIWVDEVEFDVPNEELWSSCCWLDKLMLAFETGSVLLVVTTGGTETGRIAPMLASLLDKWWLWWLSRLEYVLLPAELPYCWIKLVIEASWAAAVEATVLAGWWEEVSEEILAPGDDTDVWEVWEAKSLGRLVLPTLELPIEVDRELDWLLESLEVEAGVINDISILVFLGAVAPEAVPDSLVCSLLVLFGLALLGLDDEAVAISKNSFIVLVRFEAVLDLCWFNFLEADFLNLLFSKNSPWSSSSFSAFFFG